MLQVNTEGNRPFVLQAVIHDTRKHSNAATYLHANLFSQVMRMVKGSLGGKRIVSPLYWCLVKLIRAYVKSFPGETQASLLQTDCSMAVLDITSGRLYTLCFGKSAHLAHVASELGHAAEPVTMREHMVGNSIVLDAAYESFQTQHHVVLGSKGLWCAASCFSSPAPVWALQLCTFNVTGVLLSSCRLCTEHMLVDRRQLID